MQWNEFRSHIRHLPAAELSRIERAFELGKHMHGDQKRKSGEPYFQHPIAVAHMLADLGADPDTLVAALLHDTVEDTPLTLEEIDEQFDGSVKTLIDGVTKLSSKDVAMSPKLTEQMETLRKIFTLMERDVRIMVIKLIDRLHNMQTIEFLSPERQQLLATETQEVFVKIADKLCMQDLRDELEILCLSVLEPALYSPLVELRNANEQRGIVVIDSMRTQLATHNRLLTARTDMVYENKSWDQLKAQVNAGNTIATGVTFVTAVFVCENLDSCYQMLGALHQVWKREILSFQDFINTPQLNGYRGLHTTIIAQDGTRVRCKIRTEEMHEYARKGVASVCFSKTSNIEEILPWTKHLSPLAADTEGNSKDFWQNLQSDILGQSITIHGPNDNTVQLPSGATALDAAFYLFQDLTLRTQAILVNGVDVTFNMPIQNGATVEIVMAEKNTCTREWLRSVQTGYAAAKIRSVLMHQTEDKKLDVGREMLQKVFSQRRRGFIEEFNEEMLQSRLSVLGYASLKDVYISIADGRLEPATVYTGLFQSVSRKRAEFLPSSVLHYSIKMDDAGAMDRVNLIHRKYATSLSKINYQRRPNGTCTVTLSAHMSPEELVLFREDLALAGAEKITTSSRSPSIVLLMVTIILLWGLDPVFARLLVINLSIPPVDLTIIRFTVFFLASAFMYVLHMTFSQVKAKTLWPLQPSLLFSGLALFCTAILSYIALSSISATQYIFCIVAGLVVVQLVRQLYKKSISFLQLFSVIALAAGLIVIIHIQGSTLIGLLAGAGSAIGFAAYSLFSKRYQETDARIHARYPAFVFWLSAIAIVPTLFLLLFTNGIPVLPLQAIAQASIFALVFCFLPYVLYFECMHKTDASVLDRLLPFVSLATILGELETTGTTKLLWVLPLLALFLWANYPRSSSSKT